MAVSVHLHAVAAELHMCIYNTISWLSLKFTLAVVVKKKIRIFSLVRAASESPGSTHAHASLYSQVV